MELATSLQHVTDRCGRLGNQQESLWWVLHSGEQRLRFGVLDEPRPWWFELVRNLLEVRWYLGSRLSDRIWKYEIDLWNFVVVIDELAASFFGRNEWCKVSIVWHWATRWRQRWGNLSGHVVRHLLHRGGKSQPCSEMVWQTPRKRTSTADQKPSETIRKSSGRNLRNLHVGGLRGCGFFVSPGSAARGGTQRFRNRFLSWNVFPALGRVWHLEPNYINFRSQDEHHCTPTLNLSCCDWGCNLARGTRVLTHLSC